MKFFLVILSLMGSANIFATDFSRVLIKDSKEMDVKINKETVRCSAVGYRGAELKINIKGLDGWTVLDHSNVNFGELNRLPCMTAGACKSVFGGGGSGGFSIDDIIQNNPRTERITVYRELSEERKFLNGKCERFLVENLLTNVAGVEFKHRRSIKAETLPAIVCGHGPF